jgi:hypothetical protein
MVASTSVPKAVEERISRTTHMNPRFVIGLLVCAAVTAASCSKPRTTEALPPVNALASGQSVNWRVDILSAKKQRDHTVPSDPLKPNVYYIELKMRIQYRGPSGTINPPVCFFNVATPEREKKEQKYGPVGMTFDQDPENFRLATWFFKGQPTPAGELKQPGPDSATSFETGKTFPLTIHYPYPTWFFTKTEFRLEFAEIPMITFTVTPEGQ